MKVINKKIRSKFFNEIVKGNKTFELRKEDDTRYEEGDYLILNEIIADDFITGRIIISQIGFVLRNFEGLSDNYAIISLKDMNYFDFSIKENKNESIISS